MGRPLGVNTATGARARRAIAAGLAALLVAGCSAIFGPDRSFDEAEQEATERVDVVAAAIGGSPPAVVVFSGLLTCPGGEMPAVKGTVLLDRVATDEELASIDAALVDLGYEERDRARFAVGDYILWRSDDSRSISVTVDEAEGLIDVLVQGPCATPRPD